MMGFLWQVGRRGSHRRGSAVGLAVVIGALTMAMAASAAADSPTVTKVKPSSGSTAGGTTVTITGSNFTGATAVNFGSTNATSYTVNSEQTITAVSPAETAGKVDLTVTTPGGTSAVSNLDHFRYLPTVTNVSPNSGPTAGATSVTVTGAGFGLGTTATKFRFGKAPATAVNCGTTTTCTVRAPAHEAGTIDVKAGVNKVVSVKNPPADQFTYIPTDVKGWDLTQAFAEHPEENPLPDQFNNPGVWRWMSGEADTPTSYVLMENFHPSTEIEEACGVKGFFEWTKEVSLFSLPAVFYNSGPTLAKGENGCAGSARYPTKTFFMHPDNGSSLASIVGWQSPITSVVTISGSVQPTDSHTEGIIWQLDQGSAILLGPTGEASDSLTSFGPTTVSVNAGESLYFEIGRGKRGGSFDTTAVTLDITH